MDILVAIALVLLAVIVFKTVEAFLVALVIVAIAVWAYRKMSAEARRRG